MTAHLKRAMVLFEQARHKLAARELRQHLSHDPQDAVAHALLSICLTNGEKHQKATAEAQQAIHLDPELSLAHHALAVAYQNRNRLDEARTAIREAIRLDPYDPMLFSTLAGIQFNRRKWDKSLRAAERGLEIDPEDVECANYRAMALVKLGRKQDARATLKTALARDPDNAATHANQGWTLLEQVRPRESMQHFQEALRLDPDLDWARLGIVEAMKARNVIYRLLLAYFLWTSKLSNKSQWIFLIGLYIGFRVIRSLARANPGLEPFVWPVIIVYIGFVALTWIGQPLFNLLLRIDRYGRLALSREQVVASNWIGACLLGALICLGTGLMLQQKEVLYGALGCVLLIIPLSATFECSAGWPKYTMAALSIALAGLGIIGFGLHIVSPSLGNALFGIFIAGAMLSSWVGNALMMVEPKH